MAEPILKVFNKGMEHPGFTSFVDHSNNSFIAYTENDEGHQIIFRYERDKDKAFLYHSDLGWRTIDIEQGVAPPEFNFTMVERLWLATVWIMAKPVPETTEDHQTLERLIHVIKGMDNEYIESLK